MSQADSWIKDFKPGARCNIEQYKRLKRCSEKKDTSEWNQWRKAHEDEEIWLSGADLDDAHLEGAELFRAHLEGADLEDAHLEGAELGFAHLQGAVLWDAHLEGAVLWYAHLEEAVLSFAHLEGAELWVAHLEGARLVRAHLEGAKLFGADLEGAMVEMAVVDGNTVIWACAIDKDTDFIGVGLDSARVEPGLKQLLEYNIRRKRWLQRYKEGALWRRVLKRIFVQPFWLTSDYGRSTGRIVGVFFGLALAFAGVYCAKKDCLSLATGGELNGFLHALYFSVVTMTTLGFGDIHANPDSSFGQVLLMLQVLLGYVLLAALVTRFAVLFTGGGPAGSFARKKDGPPRLRQADERWTEVLRRRRD